jgi:hypothetical protein
MTSLKRDMLKINKSREKKLEERPFHTRTTGI